MSSLRRHRCLIYQGSPAPHLQSLAALIQQRLTENYRCLFVNSLAMVAGIRSYLSAAGTDVTKEMLRGRLVIASDHAHLLNRQFNADRMIHILEQALAGALNDGYQGLFATGDMSWEFGPAKDFSQLLDYERLLEEFLQAHPAFSGVCQYRADLLPPEVMRHGLVTHPSLYINETLSRLNPHYADRGTFNLHTVDMTALDETLRSLYSIPDALLHPANLTIISQTVLPSSSATVVRL